MILVTGATGHFGNATIQFLLKKGIPAGNIAALVRDEAKAAGLVASGIIIKKGDYDNYPSLTEAFKGVDKLLLVSGNDVEKRAQQQLDAVKAAKEAGVKHILYTSFERKNESGHSPIEAVAQSHIATENAIKASGITYTIFRNNLYADLLPMFMGEKVLETGIFFPAGNTPVAFTFREDMAEATANVLATEGHENKTYSISNTEAVSFPEIADCLSQVSGKNIGYTSPTVEGYIDALTAGGLPAGLAAFFGGFAAAMEQGEFESVSNDLQALLQRKPASVKAFLAQVYGKKD
jgi:NAD(P)H dehydrogenase (quinone)